MKMSTSIVSYNAVDNKVAQFTDNNSAQYYVYSLTDEDFPVTGIVCQIKFVPVSPTCSCVLFVPNEEQSISGIWQVAGYGPWVYYAVNPSSTGLPWLFNSHETMTSYTFMSTCQGYFIITETPDKATVEEFDNAMTNFYTQNATNLNYNQYVRFVYPDLPKLNSDQWYMDSLYYPEFRAPDKEGAYFAGWTWKVYANPNYIGFYYSGGGVLVEMTPKYSALPVAYTDMVGMSIWKDIEATMHNVNDSTTTATAGQYEYQGYKDTPIAITGDYHDWYGLVFDQETCGNVVCPWVEVKPGQAASTARYDDDMANKTSPGLPTPTSPYGYTFDGWFTDKAFTNQITADTIINEPLYLYAKWQDSES